MMSFGEKLRALRSESGLTQPELAGKIGIEQSYLSKLENDRSVPSAEILNSLVNTYSLTTEEILLNVDLNMIRKSFGHIPMLTEQLKQYDETINRYHQRWILSTVALIISGILIFLLGQQHVIFDNKAYNYKSVNELLWYERDDGTIMDTPIKFETLHRTFLTNKGPAFTEMINNQEITFGLNNTVDVSYLSNRLLMVIGILLFASGLLAIILEKRIHSPAISSGNNHD